MGKDLVPRRSASPSRQLAQDLQQVRGQALVRAARTESVGFVASIGLHQIAGLTALEAQLIKTHPLGEARFEAIVDSATVAIAQEIASMVWR